MDIVCISDTHGLHHSVRQLPEGDLLIHGGDITEYGTQEEVDGFIRWFEGLPFRYKVFTGGNHDFALEQFSGRSLLSNNCHFLNNESVEIEGYKLYGSPVTPYSLDMAFNKRAEAIAKAWDQIPPDTDILLTHAAPKGMLDDGSGCPYLTKAIAPLNLLLHVFGHIHSGYGMAKSGTTTCVNAALANEKAIMDMEYRLVNKTLNVSF